MDIIAYQDSLRESELWELIENHVPGLRGGALSTPFDPDHLFDPPMQRNLALWFLESRKRLKQFDVLKTDQLYDMASGVDCAERDIDESPGVYAIFRLACASVLKVGQSNNLRSRIAHQHLRYPNQPSESNVIVYARLQSWDWPNCINDDEFVALLFPMWNSIEAERCFIEDGLRELLHPDMR